RRRAPNFTECVPSASIVVFVTSQRVFVLNESPTVAPPVVNASSTLTAVESLSAAWFVWLCMNWKRVSLTVFLLSTAVSVSWSVGVEVEEEGSVVGDDRVGDVAAVLAELEGWSLGASEERVARVHALVVERHAEAAAQAVRAGLGENLYAAEARLVALGGERVVVDADFAYRVLRGDAPALE